MSSLRIRPTFSQTIPLGIADVQQRIVHAVEADPIGRFEVKNFPNFICLRIREQDRHFWTPRLTLSIEETDDGHTRIEGIYGPNANVWSLYLYGYLITGSFGIFAACLGYAQWIMDKHPWGLWILTGLGIIAISLYVSAQFGQKLGAQQMFMIHQAYESAIGTMVEVR